MTNASTATNLLKMLGSSGGAPMLAPGARAGKPDVGTADFKELLGLAQKGEMDTGRAVSIDPGLNIDLTPDQVKALSAAADQAEAAGLNRALVMIGGRGLVLDVASRAVTAAADMGTPGVLSQIDGVVSAQGREGDRGVTLTPPVNPIGNLSLAHLLAQSDPAKTPAPPASPTKQR